MELVRGGTLQDRMDAGPMSPRFAMRVAAEVAAALAAAHADGLVHRDIKPANVMVTETGAKVVDFGIAAAVNPAGTGDDDFEVLGTPAYLAPERLTGDGVEPASDVYALGVLLYRMLSGHSPWSADTTTQMLSAHVYVDPEPLPQAPGVPDYVTALCNRCLSKDTTERPSAREVAALLAQGAGLRVVEDEAPAGAAGPAYDSEPSLLIRRRSTGHPRFAGTPLEGIPAVPPTVFTAAEAEPPPSIVESPDPAGRRHRLVLPAIAVFVLVLLAGLLGWLLGPDRDAGRPSAAAPVPEGDPVASAPASTPPSGAQPTRSPAPGVTPTTRRPAAGAPRTTAVTRGGPPTSTRTTAPEPTRTTPPADSEPVVRTFSSEAGTVRATCPEDSEAQLLSWSGAESWKVKKVVEGPAAKVSVAFKNAGSRIRMVVTCSGGVPSGDTVEN
jgi:serine/threonine-protein kinase